MLDTTRPAGAGCADVATRASVGVFGRALREADLDNERVAARHEARRRLRSLVHRIDEIVDVCEAAHLGQARRAPDDLVRKVLDVLVEARSVLPAGRETDVCDALLARAAAVRDPLVRHLMELVWAIQGATFDELLPRRRELDDNDDDLVLGVRS